VAEGWPGFRYTYLGYKLASLTNSEGERVVYGYSGGVTSVTQTGPGSPVQRFQYEGRDAAGVYHTRFWNPLGEERLYAYDALGRLLERREVASAETTTWAWSGERCVAHTLPNGATTTWSFLGDDAQLRTDPSGNSVAFSYQPSGVDRENPRVRPLALSTDSLGAIETRSYDAAGRLVERSSGAGDVTSFSWAQGMLASETSQGITRSFSQYGEHGHAVQVDAVGVTQLRVFDAVGNLVQGAGDGPVAGGVQLRAFDADRNLAALTLVPLPSAGGAETIALEYRSDGQRTRVLRGGDDHEFGYDAFGRMLEQRERTDGVWQITRFGYDVASRLSFVERPNGMREELTFGPADRVTRLQRLRGGALEGTLVFAYEDGQLLEIDDSQSGLERYAYDAAGRRVTTTFAGGERIETQYDQRSRASAESFVAAQGALLTTLLYEHDLVDRRVGVSDASGELWGASHANGRLSELRYGNGLVRSFSYRSDGVPDGTVTRDGAGAVLESTTLETGLVLDDEAVYRIHQRATTTTHGAVDVTTVEDYELLPFPDGFPGSAVGPRIAAWNDGLSAGEDYVFDARSNLLAMGDTQFEYNAERNRLLGVSRGGETVGSYTYDAAGFATSRNGEPLQWNAAGRLLAHGSDNLVWDGLGRLRSVQVAGVTAHFAFGGRAQADAAGNPLALDLGDVVVGLAGVQRYRHLDFRGNVKFVSDDAGEVVAHYRYAPFGLDAVFGADTDPVRFVARPEIGELMLLGARVYDPAVGRFLSPDPLFQTVNQFAYTLGNPIWFSDADGQEGDPVADGISAAGAALSALGRTLALSADPRAQALGEILMVIGAWLVALAAAMRLRGTAGAMTSPTLGGGGGGSGGGPGGTGCSPAALSALPDLPGWLRLLLPLQLLLGWLELRRRRRRAGSLA
jgi:RHS repeat-associated protein